MEIANGGDQAGGRARIGSWMGVLAMALFVAACGGADSGGAAAGGDSAATGPALRIGYSDWPGWVTWEIAREKGFFAANGVNVELVWMDYVPSMEAFAAGQLDAVTMTNGDALVSGATAQKASTAILINDYSNGNDMIIARPGLETVADLRGKRIGVEIGFVAHLLLLHALESAGIAETEVELVNIPTNEAPQALASGGVDAISAWQPSSGQALRIVPGSKALFTSADVPGIIYDLLYVARESLAARGDDWLAVTRAWYDVVDYMSDPANRTEMLRILSGRVGLTPAEYEPLLAGTHILSLPEVLPILTGGPEAGFESFAGSTISVDEFNVKYEVYGESEYNPAYLDPSLTLAVARERGVPVPE